MVSVDLYHCRGLPVDFVEVLVEVICEGIVVVHDERVHGLAIGLVVLELGQGHVCRHLVACVECLWCACVC